MPPRPNSLTSRHVQTSRPVYDLTQTEHAAIFDGCKFAWDALKKIEAYIASAPKQNPPKKISRREHRRESFHRRRHHRRTRRDDQSHSAIIGSNCQIRHNAYIRENVIIGDGCVVGEFVRVEKLTLLFNGAQVPHFNYIGDSILEHKAHLGAGVKISNFKLFPGNITVELDGVPFDTGLRKFGALLGDGAEAGCNAVLNPGSILGRGAVVYPNVFWRGILPTNMIAKNKSQTEVVVKKRPRES